MSLTPNGRIVLRKAAHLLAEARELLDLSAGLCDDLEGELRLGVIPTLGPYLLPLILKSIKTHFPKVQLKLFEEPTLVLEQMLAERALDAALTASDPKQDHLDTQPLFFEPFVLACPMGVADDPTQAVSLAQVMQSDLVLLSQEHCLRDQTMALCHMADLQGQRVASSLEMLRHFVALGEGSALFPVLSVAGPDRFGGLATLHPVTGNPVGRHVRLTWRNSDPRAEHLGQFGAFIQSHMKTPPMQNRLSLCLQEASHPVSSQAD